MVSGLLRPHAKPRLAEHTRTLDEHARMKPLQAQGRVVMRYDVALLAPGVSGKARAAERGQPRSRAVTPHGASGAGNPQNMSMGRRPSRGNPAP